jgi:hypothetical protein
MLIDWSATTIKHHFNSAKGTEVGPFYLLDQDQDIYNSISIKFNIAGQIGFCRTFSFLSMDVDLDLYINLAILIEWRTFEYRKRG